MLSSISWQHYLAAILLLTATYYSYVLLRYYQQEIAGLFNRNQDTATVFSSVQPAPVPIMGKAKPDNGTSFSEVQGLQFAEPVPDEVEPAPDPSQELVTEAGNLMDAFKESGSKPEFLGLLKILIEPYRKYAEEIDLPATLLRITEVSKAKLPFPLTSADLKDVAA